MNISIVFITQCYFRALKDARLNSTHYILMKIGNKNQKTLIIKTFLKMCKYCTSEPYCFMTIDARPNATIVFRKDFTGFP